VIGINRQRLYSVVDELAREGLLTRGDAPSFALSIPRRNPAEQARNTPRNTVPEAEGVPGVPLVEGREHAEHPSPLIAPTPTRQPATI
jgi:hypothetical protein